MENPRIRVGVIIVQDGHILLVQHKKGGKSYWLLPGGGLRFGETLQECAERELLEETNLRIKIEDLAFISETIPPDGHRHIINLFFFGKILDGELRIGNDEILQNARFFDKDGLDDLLIYPPIKEDLKRILRGEKLSSRNLGNMWIG